ncbi:MAG TPA: hypothetical protein VIW72_03055 [Burkholderiales bacterium]
MTTLLWIVALGAVGFFLFHRSAKSSMNKQLCGAVTAVQIGTYTRLARRYEGRLGKEGAVDLAVAVTNALFGNVPAAGPAATFKKNNEQLIERSLRELKDDQDLRIVVTDANRVLAGLKHNSLGQAQALDSFDHLQRLIELGVLIPDRPAPQQLSLFLQMARTYHDQNRET